MRAVLLGATALSVMFSGGCHSLRGPALEPEMGASVREITYAAIDQLIAQHPHRNEVGRLLVATVVDLNDVNRTSMFGRQMTEYASARLTQLDYDVIHATVRQDHMLVRQDGLFLLSRDIRNLVADYNAKSVVVGTYGLVNDFVFVSLKLVSTVDDSTLAAVDFTIKREGPVVEMLSAPGAMR